MYIWLKELLPARVGRLHWQEASKVLMLPGVGRCKDSGCTRTVCREMEALTMKCYVGVSLLKVNHGLFKLLEHRIGESFWGGTCACLCRLLRICFSVCFQSWALRSTNHLSLRSVAQIARSRAMTPDKPEGNSATSFSRIVPRPNTPLVPRTCRCRHAGGRGV